MNILTRLIEYIITILKFSFCFIICKTYGIFIGGLICLLTFKSKRFLTEKLFNLKHLGLDKPLLGHNPAQRYNIMVTLIIEDFDSKKLKTHMIENGIKKTIKLMSTLVYKFYDYYWKFEKNPTKREKMIENTFVHAEIPGEENLLEYCQKEVKIHVDNSNTEKFPYETHLIKFKNSTRGCLIFKCDHVLSDGMGLVAFICSLADNYSEDIFHPMMRSKNYSVLQEILGVILFPFYLLRNVLNVVILNKFEKTRFKKRFDTNDSPHTGNTIFALSSSFHLSNYEKARKSLKISFNDMTVLVILKSFRKHLDVRSINLAIPFGKTGIPKSVKEVEIKNKSAGIFLELPLIDSIEAESPKISKILSKELKNFFNVTSNNVLFTLIVEFLPSDLLIYINDMSIEKVDLIHSNVPGPIKELFYSGCKVVDILPIISTGRIKAMLPVFSYNKKFRVVVAYDESVGLNPKDLLGTIENELQQIERKYN
jgi:hypothetical protein